MRSPCNTCCFPSQSPEKLQASLSRLAHEVDTERELLADAERKTRELQGKADAIARLERDVAKATAAMEELEGEIAAKKDVSKRVKALKADIAANEKEVASLSAQQQHLKRTQAALEERLGRLEKQVWGRSMHGDMISVLVGLWGEKRGCLANPSSVNQPTTDATQARGCRVKEERAAAQHGGHPRRKRRCGRQDPRKPCHCALHAAGH